MQRAGEDSGLKAGSGAVGAKQGWGEGKSFCCVWQGRGREWLWDWDLPAFLGWGIGKGMPWVTPLPCHGSQSTCIQVTPSQLFRVWEVDITQPRPNDLPELTQQAALQLSIAPAPSISTPTHSTSALRAQGLGGNTGMWACGRTCVHSHTHSPLPGHQFKWGHPFSFLSPNNNPSASHSLQGIIPTI